MIFYRLGESMKNRKRRECNTLTKLMLPLLKNNYPSLLAKKMYKEQPMEIDLSKKEIIEKMVINGGLIHDFIRGYIYTPYQLSIIKVTKYKNTLIRFTEVLKVLDEVKTEDEFNKVKDKWEDRIKKFNKKALQI